MADAIQSIRHKLHSIVSDTESYTVPAIEEIRQMIPTELADRELGIIKNVAGTDARIFFRAGTSIYEIQKVGANQTEYNGQFINRTLTPTLVPETTFYNIDLTSYKLIRLETFATCYDITFDKYYSWQKVSIIRNTAGTLSIEREYYTKEDKDGNTSNTNVAVEINGGTVDIGIVSAETGVDGDGFAMTKIIALI